MLKTKSIQNDAIIEAAELIDELSKNTADAVKQMRETTRLEVRIKVFVEPGNISAHQGVRFQGITGNISAGGTQILLARPLQIGDIYQVSFDRSELDHPPVYALCLRGRMVRKDAYEAGLKFLEPFTLPSCDDEIDNRTTEL